MRDSAAMPRLHRRARLFVWSALLALGTAAPHAQEQTGDVPYEGEPTLLERQKWFCEKRAESNGEIPWGARLKALHEIEKNVALGILGVTPAGLPGNDWLPMGPSPIQSGTATYSGRVTAIAPHPTDANTVYVGGASGGVWKTTDAGATWMSLTDKQASLATGSITIDPSNANTVYVGTGEPNFSCDSYFGAGILKSTDAGATWTLIGSGTFVNTSISKVIVHPTVPSTLWAANTYGAGGFICYQRSATRGVWKSTNGGTTWTNTTSGDAMDMVLDPTNASVLYTGIRGSGVRKSTDGGSTFVQLAGGLPSSNVGRVDVAIDPGATSVYAAYEAASTGGFLGLYKSTDAGTSWSSTGAPGSCNGQCWYNLYVDVAPNGNVFLGAFSTIRSTNGGGAWSTVSAGMHVDHHAIGFAGNGDVWEGNDGGIYRSTNGGTAWTSRNTNLALTQFYPGDSLHPTSSTFAIAGAQDNGTNKWTGTTTWTTIYGGDGAFSAIDFTDPANDWYVSWQRLNILKTTNAGGSFSPAVTGLTEAGTTAAPFIAPFVMCPANAQVLLAGTDNPWRTVNGAANWVSNGPDPLSGSNQIYSLAFSPTNCNIAFAGLRGGTVWRVTDGGTTWTSISTGLPTRGVNDLAVHPTDANIVYAALTLWGGGHVYKTTNALAATPSWTNVSTGLPDAPANAVLIDPADPNNTVLVGTDVGIFRSTNGGTSWAVFMNGHPNVVVHDLVAGTASGVVASFTHGRGAFRLTTNPPGEAGVAPPLLVRKVGGSVVFTWGAPGASCASNDYAIYKGDLATLASGYNHGTQLVCGNATRTFGISSTDPKLGNADYYLVVAANGTQEGSYGRRTGGTERPMSSLPCRATQNLSACP